MSALEVAAEHARIRRDLAAEIRELATDAWVRVDPARISETWSRRIARLLLAITVAQRVAAAEADTYLDEALDEQGIDPATAGDVDVEAFAGVASDGRPLESLLAQPAIVTLSAIGAGYAVDRAMATGGFLAGLIGHTQVADAGRVADQVALTARKDVGGYVRMVVGRTCGRCIVLAGRRYEWNAGFRRHPRCDCVHIPTAESDPDDLRVNTKALFGSMTPAEQVKAFGKAGAEAIRLGADPAQVVNARRGLYTAGGRLYTTSGAGRRPRAMPETLLAEANGDRGEALRLLKLHGFIR